MLDTLFKMIEYQQKKYPNKPLFGQEIYNRPLSSKIVFGMARPLTVYATADTITHKGLPPSFTGDVYTVQLNARPLVAQDGRR